MRKLLKYMKGYRLEAVLGPFFKLTEAMFELFVPLLVANIIDIGIKTADKGYITERSLLMVALGVIGFICAVTAQYFAAKASVGFAAKLRHALFEKVQDFSFSMLDKIGTSTLITRITSDVNQVQTGVNLTLRLLLRSPFIVFGAMIMAFTVDTKSALIFVATIPVLAIIVVAIMMITIPLYKKVQSKLDKVLLKVRENLKGVRVIRAFCKEEEEIQEFKKQNDTLLSAQIFVGKISALMNPLTYVIINAAVIGIIWFGGVRVNQGNLTTGQIVALYNYMSQILVELIKFANMIITLNKSLAAASRIEKILSINETTTKNQNVQKETQYIIEFDNVSFKYDGSAEDSLSDISFKIKKGESIGIIGSTGSGKTTLINLLSGFYKTTKGHILIDGSDINCIDNAVLRESIGIALQKSVLFKGSLRENMLLGDKSVPDSEIVSALKTANAYDFILEKGGLDFEIEQGGKNLSGGQKQRLTVARALVGKPPIIILDDSYSALDFATEAFLRKSINELDFSPTVFTVSQRVSSVMHCDKILVLEDGSLAGFGTHKELLKSCETYIDICRIQLGEGV